MTNDELTENDMIRDGAEYPEVTTHLISLWKKGKISAKLNKNGRIVYAAIFCTAIIDNAGTVCGTPCDTNLTYEGEPVCKKCFEFRDYQARNRDDEAA